MNFLVIEIETDFNDSRQFKTSMLKHGLGKDLTPPLKGLKRKTQAGGRKMQRGRNNVLSDKSKLTILNFLRPIDLATIQVRIFFQSITKTKPVVLYVSGHHSTPTDPIFYNNHDVGIEFKKGFLEVGYFAVTHLMDIFMSKGRKAKKIKVPYNNFQAGMEFIILDACSLSTSKVITGATSELQKFLAGKNGKPVVLGFHKTSPQHGTAPLHKEFVNCLARIKKRQLLPWDIINCWLQAGRSWKGKMSKKYKRHIGAIDKKGRLFDNNGKLISTT